jgi:hypothetical protein
VKPINILHGQNAKVFILQVGGACNLYSALKG